MRGDDDKVAGAVDTAKGKVEEAIGELRGDEDQKAEGRRDQMKGSAKKGLGRVKNAAEGLTS
jgi:uncharacterized protein YjbJ (UPF0337 family)